MSRSTRRAARLLAGIGVIALVTGLGLVAAAPAYALTFTVTTAADTGPGSLRQAIIDSNTGPGLDTISIQPGLVIDMSTFTNQAVTDSVIVTGDASNPPTIIGPSHAPIFQVTDMSATYIEVDNVTMKASTTVTSGDAITTVGGAGSLTLIGDTFENFPSPAVEILLSTGRLTVTDSVFSGNASTAADADGGAIVTGSIGVVTITGSTFSHNSAGKHGGALELNDARSVNISGSTFDSNSAGIFGGAIAVTSLISDSTWTGNTFTGNTSGAATSSIGGAAFYMGSVPTGATFLIDQSTFSGNTAAAQSPATAGAVGFIRDLQGAARVLNSTMTGNSFTGVGSGAGGNGIDLSVSVIEATGEFDLGQSTFDEAASGDHLVYVTTNLGLTRLGSDTLSGPGVLIVSNDNNAAADAVEVFDTIAVSTSSFAAIDISGTPAEISYSITSDSVNPEVVDLGGTQFGVSDPQLGALGNNGGPTQTRLPLPGSPAIDLGDPAFGGAPATDQRGAGFPRILNGRVDIGAVETPAATLAATGLDPAPTVWTASTTLLTGALLLGAVLLTRRRRNTAK